MHATTDLQWLLSILIFAGLIFEIFSFCAKNAKIRPPRKKGFTVVKKMVVFLCTLEFGKASDLDLDPLIKNMCESVQCTSLDS